MKKKKHRRKVWKAVLSFLLMLILLCGVCLLLFTTRKIQVEGNEYYGDTTVTTWIQNDKFSVNTLYILWKYNMTEAELPSAVESIKASLKNPWTVKVTVKEKDMLGYVDNDGAYLYFDREGTVVLNTKKQIEDVPKIEGLEYDLSKMEIGKELPVEDDSIFGRIMDVSRYLTKFGLAPDRLVCSDGSVNLYFGRVEVLLGSSDYEDRLAQVGPILAELDEKYPETAGTLHLENFDLTSEAIRFVPQKEEKKE